MIIRLLGSSTSAKLQTFLSLYLTKSFINLLKDDIHQMKPEGMRQSLVHIILTTLSRKQLDPYLELRIYGSIVNWRVWHLFNIKWRVKLKYCKNCRYSKEKKILLSNIFPPFVTELGNCSQQAHICFKNSLSIT